MAIEVSIQKFLRTDVVVENIDSGTGLALSEIVLKRYKSV